MVVSETERGTPVICVKVVVANTGPVVIVEGELATVVEVKFDEKLATVLFLCVGFETSFVVGLLELIVPVESAAPSKLVEVNGPGNVKDVLLARPTPRSDGVVILCNPDGFELGVPDAIVPRPAEITPAVDRGIVAL